MFVRAGMLASTFICGYLIIEWINVTHPFILAEFFIGLVISPFRFFAASLAFMIGVLCTGRLFRMISQAMVYAWKKHISFRKIPYFELIGLLFIFFFLYQYSWEHTIVFFSFSFIYGIISVDKS